MKPDQVITKMELITPEKAKELLKYNDLNRPIRKNIVDYYSNQMLNGQWTLSGQTISLTYDGRLIDGQHRLAAIIKSGKSIYCNIARNVPEESFVNYDRLRSRSTGDVLGIYGIKNARNISAALTSYFHLKAKRFGQAGFGENIRSKGQGCIKDSREKSTIDIIHFYDKHEILINKISYNSSIIRKKLKYFPESKLMAIMLYLIYDKQYRDDVVFNFFSQLYTGENIENRTIFILREKIIQSFSGGLNLTERAKLFLLIKCWNCYVRLKEVKRLNYIDNDVMPEILDSQMAFIK